MPMIHHMLRESRGPSMAAGRLSASRESRACDRCGVFDADKGPAAAETHFQWPSESDLAAGLDSRGERTASEDMRRCDHQ
jgi:hypothetical protein